MSHRRGGGSSSKEGVTMTNDDEMVSLRATSEAAASADDRLDLAAASPALAPSRSSGSEAHAAGSLSLDDRYENEKQSLKQKTWVESPFAVSLTEPTWADEYARFKENPAQECMDTADHDGVPCICCSAMICSMIGAGRVGNMAVLKQSTEWVEEIETDEEGGEPKTRRFTRPKLDLVVGPYWPMLVCVTYPLIFGLSGVTLVTVIPHRHPFIVFLWSMCTLGLIYSLFNTAFRDPGILPRYERPPPHDKGTWRWSDRTLTYRPHGAFFDPDTGVVVEGFDHTCPWTGTAIGKKNMFHFQCFVSLIFICLIFDIVLLTGGIR